MTKAQKTIIRAMVRGTYDLQKLRIEQGGRLFAHFSSRLGVKPGTKAKDAEKAEEVDGESAEAVKVLDHLKVSYKLLTSGIARNRELPAKKGFVGDKLISDWAELCLVQQFLELEARETRAFKQMEDILEDFDIYNAFLKPIRGCGPAMSAIILSEFDIEAAQYPSSMWKYSGYDVIQYLHCTKAGCRPVDLPSWNTGELDALIEKGYAVETLSSGRTAHSHHQRLVEYKDKEGNNATRKGLSYNPWLKTKLYVLATCFLKAGGPYKEVYDNYKHRINNSPNWLDKTPKHRHNAAMRYMIKRFIADLYKAWRTIEGLPVEPEYSEEKLGMVHRPHAA